jgi:hypothetical protein
MVDQVVSFTIATDDVMVTLSPPLAWRRRLGVVLLDAWSMCHQTDL